MLRPAADREGETKPYHLTTNTEASPSHSAAWAGMGDFAGLIRRNRRAVTRRSEGTTGNRSPHDALTADVDGSGKHVAMDGARGESNGGSGSGMSRRRLDGQVVEGQHSSQSGSAGNSEAGGGGVGGGGRDQNEGRQDGGSSDRIGGSHNRLQQVRARAERVKQRLEDPTLAWFCLFASAVVLATRLTLQLSPQPEGGRSAPTSMSSQHTAPAAPASMPILKVATDAIGWGTRGVATPSSYECAPLDEVCAAGALAESEGVSHVEDRQTHVFYSFLSNYVTYFLAFIALYLLSFTGLRRYQRRRDGHVALPPGSSPESSKGAGHAALNEDALLESEDLIPFALCVFSVAVSLAAVLLVPFTMLYTFAIKWRQGEASPPGQASSDFGDVWDLLFPLSNLCHFIIIPSAFFYSESEGFGWRGNGKVVSRLFETCVTVALVLALLSLPLIAVQSLRLVQVERLAFSYLLTASIGSAIFLVVAPFGFERLIRRSMSEWSSRVGDATSARGGMEVLECEVMSKLEQLRRRQERGGGGGAAEAEEMSRVESDIERLQGLVKCAKNGRKATSVLTPAYLWIAMVTSVLLPITVLARVIIWQTLGETSRLPLSLFFSASAEPTSGRYPPMQLALEAVHVAFDMGLLYYLWIATWHGIKNVPYLSKWYIKERGLGLTERMLSLHCLLFLCINTSYPLITCTMGLTQIEHVRDNSATEYFQRHGVRLGFNAIFMLACTCALMHAARTNIPGGGRGALRAIKSFASVGKKAGKDD